VTVASPILARDMKTLRGGEPFGLGTPAVESLSSYFAAVAELHHLLPRDVIRHRVAPKALGIEPGLDQNAIDLFARVLHDGATSLNGMGLQAARWVSVCGELTGTPRLDELTMLPWKAQLTSRGLTSTHRRFCTGCYWDWQQAKVPAHDLLLWTLKDVTACADHGLLLSDRCLAASCARPQPYLSSIGRTGRCFWCDESLAVDPADVSWALFVRDQLGPVVAESGHTRNGELPLTTATIDALIARVGGTIAFARRVGRPKSTVASWRFHLPTLDNLLRVSAAIGMPVLDLLIGDVTRQTFVSSAPMPAQAPAVRRVVDWPGFERAARSALRAKTAVGPDTILARYGVDRTSVRRRLPKLYRALAARFLEGISINAAAREEHIVSEIRTIVATLYSEGTYPSRRQVEPRMTRGHLREEKLRDAWNLAKTELGPRPDPPVAISPE
jgi:hypothetical protein